MCNPTINDIKQIHSDVDAFLRFRGLEDDDNIDWNQVPPYYKAMKYNHALFNDSYIKSQIEGDLKNIKIRACAGKLRCRGNYQTLTPDIYGLAQWAFGIEPTGLLNADEIFSTFWSNQSKNGLVYVPNGIEYSTVNAQVPVKELDLIRSPHIANEHCPVKLTNNQCMKFWYQYQKTGYLLSMYDTNMLKMNSADTDGDHIAGICNDTIIAAAKRCKANTIFFVQLDAGTQEEQEKRKAERMKQPNDLRELMLSDVEGYKNNIGTVVNDTSILWSLPQAGKIPEYIKVMSVIDSLVIDFVKTGITASIPESIKGELKKHKKPYFMKYTKKSNRLSEKKIKRNSEIFGIEVESDFADTSCTMNNICHYMEENLNGLKVNSNCSGEFNFTSLITGAWDDACSEKYREVRNKLSELQTEFYNISKQKYKDTDENNDEKQDWINKYRQFYAYAKNELLLVQPNISKLVNDLVAIYYTDKQFVGKDDKSILWNCFSSHMIKIAKGEAIKDEILDLTVLKARQEKFIEKKAKRKTKPINIECLANTEKVFITKPEIKTIKQNIKDTESRRYFFILLIIWRKLNQQGKKNNPIKIKSGVRNQINYNILSLLSNTDNRHTRQIIQDLKDCKVIEINTCHIKTPEIQIEFPEIKGKTSIEINSIDKCKDYISHTFPFPKNKKTA